MPFSPAAQAILDKILDKLPPQKPQATPIAKLLECHDILLSHASNPFRDQWAAVKARIESHNKDKEQRKWTISRDMIEKTARASSVDWIEVYILTMVWGFGASDDGGPYKLRTSLRADRAKQKIEETAEMVLKGELCRAFDHFCTAKGEGHLPETGESFGSKFLYAVGLNSRWKDLKYEYQPLVFDSKIIASLNGVLAYWPKRFKGNGEPYKNNKPVYDGGLYRQYCEDIANQASRLKMTSTALEQSLFENNKHLKDAESWSKFCKV
jgi:hypothetical protein